MDKLDRLGWADGISFRAYGVSAGVRVSDPTVLDVVRCLLPPAWTNSPRTSVDRLYSLLIGGDGRPPGTRRFNLLYRDSRLLARSLNLEDVYSVLTSDLRLYVAEMSPRRVFVHAGAVGWRGRAILIPGRSFSGKTTLVAELVKAGAEYYSDEYAVLDAQGRVHPFPQPLGIRAVGSSRQEPMSVEHLGGKLGRKPLPVGLVVLTGYKPKSRWRPKGLSPGRGALELLANTVPARRDPERVLGALHGATAGAAVLSGARGEAHEAAQQILESIIKPI
jgi:hypothetical protein